MRLHLGFANDRIDGGDNGILECSHAPLTEALLGKLAHFIHGVAALNGDGLYMGVHTDLLTHLAAHQIVGGNAQRLAFDIPQGHFNATNRTHGDRATTVETTAIHPLPQTFDLQRVFANDILANFLHRSSTGMCAAFKNWLTYTYDVIVGAHLKD